MCSSPSLVLLICVLVLVFSCSDAKNKMKLTKRLLRAKETNPINFMRYDDIHLSLLTLLYTKIPFLNNVKIGNFVTNEKLFD